jgi:hypothetical protein
VELFYIIENDYVCVTDIFISICDAKMIKAMEWQVSNGITWIQYLGLNLLFYNEPKQKRKWAKLNQKHTENWKRKGANFKWTWN